MGDTETDTEETDQAYLGRLEELRILLSGALGRLDELEMEAEDTESEVKDWMRTAEAFLGAGWWEAWAWAADATLSLSCITGSLLTMLQLPRDHGAADTSST